MMNARDTNLPQKTEEVEEKKMTEEVTEEQSVTPAEITNSSDQPTEGNENKKETVINQLKEIANSIENVTKNDIDLLRQEFYRIHNNEVETQKNIFIEAGGNEADFKPEKDSYEEAFKEQLSIIKEKRNQYAKKIEQEKEQNLQIKISILEEIKKIVENNDNPNKSYPEFKNLQKRWNEIKLIPQKNANELWKEYHKYVEEFYDVLKLNNEFREYDFKKNLEIKTHLCEAAEKLTTEQDVVSAFHQLQKLHQEFKETGPIEKELREDIWKRFKEASTIVNKRHQSHFENLKKSEESNLEKKTSICEKLEAINELELKKLSDWDKKTKEVIQLQDDWKKIGFAPKKMNVKIFERFRKACDIFFEKKGIFFQQMKEEMNKNLELKIELCNKAEELKDSTNWAETSKQLVQLQKDWKKIGPVFRKHSDEVWKKFVGACDYFFEQKKKHSSKQSEEEYKNLELKKEVIEEVQKIDLTQEKEQVISTIKEAIKKFNAIGFVPFKEKDKIYKEFHNLINDIFTQLNIDIAQQKLEDFKQSIESTHPNGMQSVYKEREKLVRNCETMKNKLQTYENNLGFLTTTSSKGNSLVNDINNKISALKSDIEIVEEKIRIINKKITQE